MEGGLEGLKYRHANGISNMDIKPENILISEDVDVKNMTCNHIKICDLGLSVHDNQQHDGVVPVH